MPATVNIQFDIEKILDSRGLGENKKAQKFLTNEVYKVSQPYTPFDSGALAETVALQDDSITYSVPYAHYQWAGISKNGKSFNYNGSPMRGREWCSRAFADRGNEVLQGVASIVGGKVG